MEDETLRDAQGVFLCLEGPCRGGAVAEPLGGVTVTPAFLQSCRTSCNSELRNPFQGHSEEFCVGLLLLQGPSPTPPPVFGANQRERGHWSLAKV